MSDIVGSCTDCIISAPQSPVNTLNALLNVSLGRNQITRHLATVPVTFDATLGATMQDFALGGAKSIVLTRGAAGLILSTTAPLTVTTTKSIDDGQSTITNTITVNSLLFLDDVYTSVTVTNQNATGTANITGQLVHIPAM
jgi:hypothetical protein